VKKISKGNHSSLNELNITPLLDLAFVLLVIFIITTPLPTPPPKLNYISVDKVGRLALNQQPMELPVLRPALKQMKANDPETSVVVRGAADVDYQRVIEVLDALQQADITKVGLATDVAH